MAGVAVVGAQWGDEGKGKIVDWLSERADVVVRFQGGHNAGHTLVIDGKTYKFSLLPSGIARANKRSVIGNGVVVDPWALIAEIERMRTQGLTIDKTNLLVAENAPLILPLHGELSLDQFFTMRPLLGYGEYRSPLRGLYLCGSGSHPGTGLTGGSGANAARAIARDL